MKKTDIKEIYKNYNIFSEKEITVGGWVRSVRDLKNFGFMDLNDGTSFKGIQVIFDDSLKNFNDICALNTGSSVLITGVLKLTPENKQPFELVAKNVDIICATNNEYPLQKKDHSL